MDKVSIPQSYLIKLFQGPPLPPPEHNYDGPSTVIAV